MVCALDQEVRFGALTGSWSSWARRQLILTLSSSTQGHTRRPVNCQRNLTKYRKSNLGRLQVALCNRNMDTLQLACSRGADFSINLDYKRFIPTDLAEVPRHPTVLLGSSHPYEPAVIEYIFLAQGLLVQIHCVVL